MAMPGLRAAREKAKLTQLQLAEKVGVTDAAICRYESGEREPEGSKLLELARVLKVSTDYLLTGTFRDRQTAVARQTARDWSQPHAGDTSKPVAL